MDPKKIASAIMIKIGAPKKKGEEQGNEDSSNLEMLAEDFIKAVKAEDAKEVADLFEAMHAVACAKEEDKEEEAKDSGW